MRKQHIVHLLSALALIGLAAGCSSSSSDCSSNSDCATGETCTDGKCVAPASACTPACGGQTPICDEATKSCKTCTKDEGCASGKVCDTSAAKGLCVQCMSNDNCSGATPVCETESKTCVTCTADEGCGANEMCDLTAAGGRCVSNTGCTSNAQCSGATPVCDTAAQKCVTCTATEGCSGGMVCDTSVGTGQCVACLGDTNCSGATPICDNKQCVTCTAARGCANGQYCDLTVAGGQCKTQQTGCQQNSDCTAQATPICDTASHVCVACTATEGCTGSKVCDTSVAPGACVDCLTNTNCPVSAPICNTATKTCATCTATEGCANGTHCDTSVVGGSCVACTENAHCSGATPVCNTTTKTCVTCSGNQGCSNGQVCDPTVAGGKCVGCLSSAHCSGATPACDTATKTCVACTATEGCTSGKVCDVNAAGGPKCVGCLTNTNCSASAPVCNTTTNTCVTCTATEGCPTGQTCDTTVAGGVCTGCGSNTDCGGATPLCDTVAHKCVTCTATAGCSGGKVCDLTSNPKGVCVGCVNNTHCSGATPICETTSQTCVTCTATAGCSGATPICNTAVTGGACVQCLGNTDCSGATPICNANHACEAAPAADTSAQITAVRAAGAAATSTVPVTGQNLPVQDALVTYLKPAIGSTTNDPTGFFVQGTQAGPALFVAIDPTTTTPALARGDKVSFVVTDIIKIGNSGIIAASAITGLTRTSTGNATTQLAQDLSAATDIVTALDSYECEMVKLTGTISGAFATSGTNHWAAQFDTAGLQTSSMKLRLPDALKSQLDLQQGCSLTMSYGPMWRYGTGAQPSVYEATDLTNVTCAAPKVTSAMAPTATTVIVNFDRQIGTASVLANGSQFTITPALAVTAATVNGNKIELTTASQTPGVAYTVAVAATVTDKLGAPVDASARTANFTGYTVPTGCQPQVVISQVYGGGGNSGSTYKQDFIELHNRGNTPVDVTGWTVQYTSKTGTSWTAANTTALTGVIPAGGYFLIQEGAGSGGTTDLPSPSVTGSIAMGGTDGKVALVNSTTQLTGSCPDSTQGVVDFVGYGAADCKEGTAATGALSGANSAQRNLDGCTDSNVNGSDFTVAPAAPRNSTTAANVCTSC